MIDDEPPNQASLHGGDQLDVPADTAWDEPGDIPGAGAVRRALRLRMKAAQLLVHSINPDPGGVGLAFDETCSDDAPALLDELLTLVGTYSPAAMRDGLRDEILGITMALEDDGR